MNNLEKVACAYEDCAAHVDLNNRRVTLYSGRELPIVKFWDDDGQEIEDETLDLHDEIVVVYGPYNGRMFAQPLKRGDRVVMQ